MGDNFSASGDSAHGQDRPIDLAHEQDFTLGPVTVQPSLRKVTGPLGEVVTEPKVMQVLVVLANPVAAIFSRDDLIERCWGGRVVGDSSINRVISLLRSALRETGGDAVSLENIPKVGYRIIAKDAPPPASVREKQRPVEAPADRLKLAVMVAGLVAVLALIGGIWSWQSGSDAPVETVSVALLPLETSDGVDPIYSQGLESELRAQFARIGAIEATTSESAAMLVEEGLLPAEIGERLQVDYVWSGELVLEADRVMLNEGLVSVETGEQVWQDSIASTPDAAQYIPLRAARSLATSLGLPISEDLPEASVDAAGYRLYLSAMGLLRSRGTEQRGAALSILKEVTADNPEFADGWAALAKAYYLSATPNPSLEGGNWGEAERIAQRALALDEESVDALKVAGSLDKDPEAGLAMLETAVELDPGDAEAWYWLSRHQRRNVLLGRDPLESTLRMVQIDPLWPATWGASNAAAELGNLDLAREVEADILAASITPSQRDLANARLALIDGDLSRFLDLTRRASNTQTGAERRFGASVQIDIVKELLGLSPELSTSIGRRSPDELMAALLNGELPSRAQFAEAGLSGEGFWNNPVVAQFAFPLFLSTGREAELVAFYDARFGTHDDYLAFAQMSGVPHEVIPTASPYIALAMQAVGRDKDAAAHLASAEKEMARWKSANVSTMEAVLLELQVAAATNDLDRASELALKLPDYGWPYTLLHAVPMRLFMLRENKLFDGLEQRPEVRAMMERVERQLARERQEALALGFD